MIQSTTSPMAAKSQISPMSPVSFKGKMLVRGSSGDINKIQDTIISTLKPNSGIYSFESMPHAVHGIDEATLLMATNEHAEAINGLANILDTIDGIKPMMKFYRNNIRKYLELPKEVTSAKDVLQAMKAGSFDPKELTITPCGPNSKKFDVLT